VKAFILSPSAERDLDAIKSYLLREAGISVTRYVMRELRAGMRLLGKNPGLGHAREDLTEDPVKFWLFSPTSSFTIRPRGQWRSPVYFMGSGMSRRFSSEGRAHV
jgi:plasmid stabilization system protein ParE